MALQTQGESALKESAHEGIEYPAPPWELTGRLWLGLFRSDVSLEPPAGLAPALPQRWLFLAVVRYLEGTLRYSEFLVGSASRSGHHLGLYVRSIWVDNETSMWGGRRIWGLPKEMAEFCWREDGLRVVDAEGLVAEFDLPKGRPWLPIPFLPVPGIGALNSRWTFIPARAQGRAGMVDMRVQHWSPRFGYGLGKSPIVGFTVDSFRLIVTGPQWLDSPNKT